MDIQFDIMLLVTNPVFSQSECIILEKSSYATLKFVYDISSSRTDLIMKYFRLRLKKERNSIGMTLL